MADAGTPKDESKTNTIIISSSVLYAISLFLCLARLYTRYRQRRIGVDDWLLFIGMLIATGLLITGIVGAVHGIGKHVYYLKPSDVSMTALMGIFIEDFYVCSALCIKLSLLYMLLRIVTGSKAWQRAIHALMLFIVLNVVSCLVSHHRQCYPIKALWDYSYPREACLRRETFRAWLYINSAVLLCTDLIIATLPILAIRKLQMPRRQKVAVIILMGLGFFCTAAVIPKFMSMQGFKTTTDVTWYTADLVMWTMIEVYIGIIATSIPALKKPVEKKLKDWGWMHPSSLDNSRPRIPAAAGSAQSNGSSLFSKVDEQWLHEGTKTSTA